VVSLDQPRDFLLRGEAMSDSDKGEKGKKSKGEIAQIVGRAMISIFPGGVELFNTVIKPQLNKRFEEFQELIFEGLKELNERIEELDTEKLSKNESFITTAMNASQAAIRSHQKEKLEALKNAVLNSALPNAPEDNKQAMFLSYIDDFTPLHLQLLSFINDYTSQRGSFRKQIEKAFSDLEANLYIYRSVLADLDSRGLVIKGYVGTEPNSTHKLRAEITAMGIEFIDFISSPLEEHEA